MSLALSILTLLALCYQLYLQRVHNEKSVKALIQINLTDEDRLLFVHIQNNGVGPFIVEKLTFLKNNNVYYNIQDCLTLSPASYQYVPVNESVKKVVPPGTYMEVFSKQFDIKNTDQEVDDIRRQLAALKLKVEGVDVYDNKIIVERDLIWFARHIENK